MGHVWDVWVCQLRGVRRHLTSVPKASVGYSRGIWSDHASVGSSDKLGITLTGNELLTQQYVF